MPERFVRPAFCISSVFGKALLVCGAFLCAFALSEVFVRIVAGPPAKFLFSGGFHDRQTDWDIRYGVDQDLRRQTCGPAAEKAPKVAVIGDSFVFGQGVADCRDFVSLLNQGQKRYRFVNLGVIGAGILEYKQMVRDLVDEQFQGVMLVFYGNDFPVKWLKTTETIGYSSALSLIRKYRRQLAVKKELAGRARGDKAWNNIGSVIEADPDYLYRAVEPSSESIAIFEEEFERIVALLKRRFTPEAIFVTMVPEAHTVSMPVRDFALSLGARTAPFGYAGAAYETVRNLACRQGVRFVDTFQYFKSADQAYHPHDLHWTEAGHEIMARLVLNVMD